MMGNEGSQLSGLEINEKPVEVTDGWTLHSASLNSGSLLHISVFKSDVISHSGNNIIACAAKNVMLHRHPSILKFISTWHQSGRTYLATEEVRPLSSVLSSQTPLQICIGLYSVLKALVFLHEKAGSSHNNVCCAAIYVTPDGTWKLGGFEFLCRFKDLTHKYLEQKRVRRYEKAVPPEEDGVKSSNDALVYPYSVDQYAYGVLVEEVLHSKSDDDVPALQDFREFSKRHLQNKDPSLRPSLSSLLTHPFFNHNFIKIHSFLLELPLKTDVEKHNFFRLISDDLKEFPEKLVAMQLGSLLLSRMVLLDSTAQEVVLPRILRPREVSILPVCCIAITEGDKAEGMFSLPVYKEYIVPILLQMFCVRDAQIRLLLLAHFSSFCHAFTKDQLRSLILPELLVGIKDTNELLVSATLRALADLIPVLGAVTVIGGKRGKLFTDGRPKVRSCKNFKKSPSRAPIVPVTPTTRADGDSSTPEDLPERPSPDGGEDQTPTTDEEDTEAWSDWDVAENNNTNTHEEDVEDQEAEDIPATSAIRETKPGQELKSNTTLPDISQLDIKSSLTSVKTQDEIDFFQDMEPVISKTHVVEVEPQESRSSFDISIELQVPEGWEDDLDGWGDEAETVDVPKVVSETNLS